MPKYIMDVFFEVPKAAREVIPDEDPSSAVTPVDFYMESFRKPEAAADLCSARVCFEGTDSWCQKQARKLKVSVSTPEGPIVCKAVDYEIVHCQS